MTKNREKSTAFFAPLCLCLAALLPEYVFPVMMAVAYFKTVNFKKRGLELLKPVIVVLSGFFAWQIIGLFYSGSVMSGLSSVAVLLFMVWGYPMMKSSVRTQEQLENAVFAGAVGGGVAGGIGCAQVLLFHYGELIHPALKTFFNPFWHQLDNAVASFAINHLLPDFAMKYIQRTEFIAIEERMSSTFTNPLMFACFLVMIMPLAAYVLFYSESKKRRIIGLVCFALIVGGIASSYSRGPYVYAVIVAAVLLFYGGKRAFVLVGMGGAGLGAIAVFASGVFKRLLTIFNVKDISVSTRSKIWTACFEMLKDHWVFGYGTGVNNIREVLNNNYNIKQPHAHNLFLEILLENGIFGLVLFLAVPAVFAFMMIKLARKGKKQKGIAVTFLASLAGFCMCGMTDYLFYGLKPMCYFFMLMGLGAAAVSIYNEEEKSL